MSSFLTHHRRRILVTMAFLSLFMAGLCGQLGYLMIFRSEHYSTMADDLHERERTIKAARGEIVDRNGTVIASNRTVCTVSVVHNQVEEPEAVIRMLSGELELPEAEVRKKVEKRSSREIIKTNVDKADGDRIRSHGFAGVKVDEDYKRYYPYDSLASRVLGFTGADNQGIIGLEVMYEKYLKGRDGKILTLSDAKGVEVENAAEERLEPVARRIAAAMGTDAGASYREVTLERPFYGVYSGYAALPLAGERLSYLTNDTIDACRVTNYETGKTGPVYDLDKATGSDPYELFLSGSVSLLTVDNPNARTDRELVIFRDSFGSSLAPLLLEGYSRVTLVDIRYLSPSQLGNFLTFDRQDVWFLYSTSVLNNSSTLK